MKSIAVVLMSLYCILLVGCDKGKEPFNKAKTLFDVSDYKAARSAAETMQTSFPDSKYVSESRALIEKITKIEGLISTGNKSIEDGDYEKGITAYKEALTLAPQDKIVAASKEKAEKVQKEVEEFAAKKEPEKKEILSGLTIKVIKAGEKWVENDRGGEGCFPTVDFQMMNNTPYHAKIFSAEVQYSYWSLVGARYSQQRRWDKIPIAKDTITLNNIVVKNGRSKQFTSLAKYGFSNCRTTGPDADYGGWDTAIVVEFTLETSIGQIYRKGVIAKPGSPYSDSKGNNKYVDKSGFF